MTGDRTEGQLFPGVYASAQPAGRGTLIRRGRRHQLIQTALATEAEDTAATAENEHP
jgi:S-DNA-T family DNA segregation ATPase FtsK/SpoIIIE